MDVVICIYYYKIDITSLPRIYYVNNYVDHDYNFTNWKADGINLVLVREGITEFTVSNGCKFTAKPGDVFLSVPGLSYTWRTPEMAHSHLGFFITDTFSSEILEDADVLAYQYLFETDKVNVLENSFVILPFHFTPTSGLDLEKKMNSMLMEYTHQNICSALILTETFLSIATSITRMCISKVEGPKKSDFKPAYNYIYAKKIIEYLNENYRKDLDIDYIADSLNLSKDYMCHIFRQTTNFTLVNYLNKLRINKAKELMLASSCKINIICKEVGIENEYYFSRLFRKYEGITPRQYRTSYLYIES